MRLAWLLVLLILSACAKPLPPVWTEQPQVDQLLARLAEQSNRCQALDATARVALTVQGKFLSTQQFLTVERPAALRADVLTGFGQLILQLATDGNTMAVLLNNTVPGRYLYGPATYENLSRFVKIPLRLSDLVSFLLYSPPVNSFSSAVVKAEDSQLLLVLRNGIRKQEVVFDSQLRVTEVRYFKGETPELTVSYLKFSVADDFPMQIKIVVPGQETKISVALKEVALNPVIEPRRFQLEKPANIPAEELR